VKSYFSFIPRILFIFILFFFSCGESFNSSNHLDNFSLLGSSSRGDSKDDKDIHEPIGADFTGETITTTTIYFKFRLLGSDPNEVIKLRESLDDVKGGSSKQNYKLRVEYVPEDNPTQARSYNFSEIEEVEDESNTEGKFYYKVEVIVPEEAGRIENPNFNHYLFIGDEKIPLHGKQATTFKDNSTNCINVPVKLGKFFDLGESLFSLGSSFVGGSAVSGVKSYKVVPGGDDDGFTANVLRLSYFSLSSSPESGFYDGLDYFGVSNLKEDSENLVSIGDDGAVNLELFFDLSSVESTNFTYGLYKSGLGIELCNEIACKKFTVQEENEIKDYSLTLSGIALPKPDFKLDPLVEDICVDGKCDFTRLSEGSNSLGFKVELSELSNFPSTSSESSFTISLILELELTNPNFYFGDDDSNQLSDLSLDLSFPSYSIPEEVSDNFIVTALESEEKVTGLLRIMFGDKLVEGYTLLNNKEKGEFEFWQKESDEIIIGGWSDENKLSLEGELDLFSKSLSFFSNGSFFLKELGLSHTSLLPEKVRLEVDNSNIVNSISGDGFSVKFVSSTSSELKMDGGLSILDFRYKFSSGGVKEGVLTAKCSEAGCSLDPVSLNLKLAVTPMPDLHLDLDCLETDPCLVPDSGKQEVVVSILSGGAVEWGVEVLDDVTGVSISIVDDNKIDSCDDPGELQVNFEESQSSNVFKIKVFDENDSDNHKILYFKSKNGSHENDNFYITVSGQTRLLLSKAEGESYEPLPQVPVIFIPRKELALEGLERGCLFLNSEDDNSCALNFSQDSVADISSNYIEAFGTVTDSDGYYSLKFPIGVEGDLITLEANKEGFNYLAKEAYHFCVSNNNFWNKICFWLDFFTSWVNITNTSNVYAADFNYELPAKFDMRAAPYNYPPDVVPATGWLTTVKNNESSHCLGYASADAIESYWLKIGKRFSEAEISIPEKDGAFLVKLEPRLDPNHIIGCNDLKYVAKISQVSWASVIASYFINRLGPVRWDIVDNDLNGIFDYRYLDCKQKKVIVFVDEFRFIASIPAYKFENYVSQIKKAILKYGGIIYLVEDINLNIIRHTSLLVGWDDHPFDKQGGHSKGVWIIKDNFGTTEGVEGYVEETYNVHATENNKWLTFFCFPGGTAYNPKEKVYRYDKFGLFYKGKESIPSKSLGFNKNVAYALVEFQAGFSPEKILKVGLGLSLSGTKVEIEIFQDFDKETGCLLNPLLLNPFKPEKKIAYPGYYTFDLDDSEGVELRSGCNFYLKIKYLAPLGVELPIPVEKKEVVISDPGKYWISPTGQDGSWSQTNLSFYNLPIRAYTENKITRYDLRNVKNPDKPWQDPENCFITYSEYQGMGQPGCSVYASVASLSSYWLKTEQKRFNFKNLNLNRDHVFNNSYFTPKEDNSLMKFCFDSFNFEEKEFYPLDHSNIHNWLSFNLEESMMLILSYFTRREGPLLKEGTVPLSFVDEFRYLNYSKEADLFNRVEAIKKDILNYGALVGRICYGKDFSYKDIDDPVKSCLYSPNYNDSENSNHRVIVIGWDDSFSRTNFDPQFQMFLPEGDGAWLVQDSAFNYDLDDNFKPKTSSKENNGIYYISYYDSVAFKEDLLCFPSYREFDSQEKLNRHDKFGMTNFLGSHAYGLAKFKISSGEKITRIGLYKWEPDTEFIIAIYDQFDEESKNLIGSPLISFSPGIGSWAGKGYQDKGYYTFELPKPIRDYSDGTVYVKVYYKNGYLPIEEDLSVWQGVTPKKGSAWIGSGQEDNINWEPIGQGTDYLFNLTIRLCTEFFEITNPRAMAEWEEVEGVFVSWPITANGSENEVKKVLAKIGQEVVKQGLNFYVFAGGVTQDQVESNLESYGFCLDEFEIVDSLSQLNFLFARDFSLSNVYNNIAGEHFFVNWRDKEEELDDQKNYNKILGEGLDRRVITNYYFHQEPKVSYYHLGSFFEGGNYLTDGHGSLFVDDAVLVYGNFFLKEETLDLYKENMGLTDIFKIPGGAVHLDYNLKLIDEKNFVVSDLIYSYIKNYFESNQIVNCYGKPYEFHKIFNAPEPNSTSCTYINSLIISGGGRGKVLVPQYYDLNLNSSPAVGRSDDEALKIYESLMPGYDVVGIPAYHAANLGGSVHCLTKEIGVRDSIFISHDWYEGEVVPPSEEGFLVSAYLKAKSGIRSAEVIWWLEEEEYPKNKIMMQGNETYGNYNPYKPNFHSVSYIPNQESGTKINYYLSVSNNKGKVLTKPYSAKYRAYDGGYYSFIVKGDPCQEIVLLVDNTYEKSVGYDSLPQAKAKALFSLRSLLSRQFLSDNSDIRVGIVSSWNTDYDRSYPLTKITENSYQEMKFVVNNSIELADGYSFSPNGFQKAYKLFEESPDRCEVQDVYYLSRGLEETVDLPRYITGQVPAGVRTHVVSVDVKRDVSLVFESWLSNVLEAGKAFLENWIFDFLLDEELVDVFVSEGGEKRVWVDPGTEKVVISYETRYKYPDSDEFAFPREVYEYKVKTPSGLEFNFDNFIFDNSGNDEVGPRNYKSPFWNIISQPGSLEATYNTSSFVQENGGEFVISSSPKFNGNKRSGLRLESLCRVYVESDLSLSVESDKSLYSLNDEIVLRASLSNGVKDALVKAELLDLDGNILPGMTFAYDSFENNYKGIYTPISTGYLDFKVTAINNSESVDKFQRVKLFSVPVSDGRLVLGEEEETFNYTFVPGWNLISLPVLPKDLSKRKVSELFPGVDLVFEYLHKGGYGCYNKLWDKDAFESAQRTFNDFKDGYLSAGVGYWVYVESKLDVEIIGYEVKGYELKLYRGWNLIGSLFDNLETDLLRIYDGEDFSNNFWGERELFRYNSGNSDSYQKSTVLVPGVGYWIKVDKNLILEVN
jgi:agmatine/peptidylarginine deiminase